ncbi:23S rRNA (pseudouridine(1915)-N(3))-methyltransferase RlmH [Lacibacterium aquatile]|uniref:Ribosomal RNA large subunit methyltransferase H n=1 Tax=Lacibacterium aquatile TaxID=1168082 RepID=A0ABW5DXY3_9PROT
MRRTLIAVGKCRDASVKALFDEYAGRLSPRLALIEVEDKKKPPPPDLKLREGRLILDAIPTGATLIALDEKGKSLDSPAFAARIGKWQDSGVQDLVFCIGGADGLDDAVRQRADFLLSLGALTWPHMLVRVLIAEQLYRAETILSGHPYHRV